MKRFAIILLAAAGLVGSVGVASAQHRGGSSSGGSMHSGDSGWQGGGSGWHGGGSGWRGGGSSWHGGGNWHGGGWNGHGSRFFVGVGFGAPWWGWGPGYYSYYPYSSYYSAYPYYADYPYGYDYTAPGYVQRDAPTYTQPRSFQGGEYSYYCPDPAGYYPQVATCASGWLRVVPSGTPGPTAPTQR